MFFEIVGEIGGIETIASGKAIRELNRRQKGVCEIRLRSGLVVSAELHWYEAHGIGRREFKVKRLMD